jgi:hypothetical protein
MGPEVVGCPWSAIRLTVNDSIEADTHSQPCEVELVNLEREPIILVAAMKTRFEVFTNAEAMNLRENHDRANVVATGFVKTNLRKAFAIGRD